MKALLLFALAVSAAGADPAVSGKWQVHQSIVGNESDMICNFTQTAGELSGSCDVRDFSVKISGKVDNKKVSWTYKSEYNGSPLTVNYTGTLESSKITGTVSVPEYSVDGEFTATQSK